MSFSFRPFRLMAMLSALALVFALAACDSDGGDDDGEALDTEDAERAADSGPSDDPEATLQDAVAAMADWDGVELSLALQADDDARASMLANEPDEEETLDLLLNSSVRMIAVGDDDAGAVQFAVNVDGTDVFELYMAASGDTVDDLALRVDLPAISELVDDPTMQIEIDQMIAQAGAFGLQDAAEALADGGWVAIAGLDEAISMMEDFAGPLDEEQPDEAQLEDAQQALADRTQQLVEQDLEVTHVGNEDAGERLRLVADGPALQAYLDDVIGILATNDLLEGVTPQELQSELDDIPADAEISLDVWIAGGELSQVAIDLAAIEDSEIDGEALLVIGMAEHSGDLTAPAAAANVDVMELFAQFMGGMALDGGFDLGGDLDLGGDAFDDELGAELSQAEADMMLSMMDCISEEDLEGFALFMPELADAAEQAIADGTLSYC